ncbi:MAG: ATPase, T2SS/T4P/T4SS family [Candidatus Omnitrophota bacterium]
MAKKFDTVLAQALVDGGFIAGRDLEPMIKEAENTGKSLQQFLVGKGLFLEKNILDILADKLSLEFKSLKKISIDKEVIGKVPVKVASYYKFIPLELKDKTLTVAASYPLDIKTQDEIRMQLGFSIKTILATEDDVIDCLKEYYGLAAETLQKISTKIPKDDASISQLGHERVEDIEKLAGDATVIRLVNQIIIEAHRKRATDIHIEPYRGGLALRYRTDGILYDSNVPPEINNFLSAIISRIKIMCNLNIVERRLPQDGRTSVRIQDAILDLRISIIPTPYGESVVIRILPTQMLYSIEKLGLAKPDQAIFETLILKPHGIIFTTGPTGSGKTTTLYACLCRINTKDRKIITIEDPIEYEMQGITQIQVTPHIGLDFARGLRSMLRHDPDIMMIGEVRDLETAEIAIRVALTGHLVFSTLHTNDAASGIARLLDIGLEPYLVASSVEAFIAQRLVRVICPHCKYEDSQHSKELIKQISGESGIKLEKDIKIYRGKGCNECNFTGFFGRTAIYEILVIDDKIKDLIVRRAAAGEIKKTALASGMRTLRQDGWRKVIDGITTPEEVMRVTQIEEIALGGPAAEIPKPLAEGVVKKEEAEEDFSDRRDYVRINYNIDFTYKVYRSKQDLRDRKDAYTYANVTKNISAGGMSFVSNEPLDIGSFLELSLKLPDGSKPMECLGRAVRILEKTMLATYEIGVCFMDISASERVRLRRLCKDKI